jgi:hypothetical protein
MVQKFSSHDGLACHDGHDGHDPIDSCMAMLEFLDGDGQPWKSGRARSRLRVIIPKGKPLMLHLPRDTPSSKFRLVCDVHELYDTLEVGVRAHLS